jgi:hypothetical protein
MVAEAEAEIGRTRATRSAASSADRDVPGTLVLTTERLRFFAGAACTLDAPIAKVDVDQHGRRLSVRVDGAYAGTFELASPLLGPIPWRWYLAAAPPPSAVVRAAPGRSKWARPDDPRLGSSAGGAQREALAKWEKIVDGGWTVRPAAEYLDDLPPERAAWNTVAEIVYIVDGWGDGPPSLLVVRLADGRWVYFQYTVNITGEAYLTIVFAASLLSLWWGAMTEGDRDRITNQMTRDRVDEELVMLDEVLERGTPRVVAHAERRMVMLRER